MVSLRAWATPLVVGSFALMSVSGVLMFFHLNSDLSKGLHEWAGFALVAGGGAHLVQNWRAFTTYLKRPVAQAIMGLGVVVTAVSLLPVGGTGGADALRPVLASVGSAPVPVLAQLSGQTSDEVVAELVAAGYSGVTEASSVKALAGDDIGAQIGALSAVFAD